MNGTNMNSAKRIHFLRRIIFVIVGVVVLTPLSSKAFESRSPSSIPKNFSINRGKRIIPHHRREYSVHHRHLCNTRRSSSQLYLQPKDSDCDDTNMSHILTGSSIRSSTTLEMNSSGESENLKIQVSPQRWIQLGYLSLLALMSDWICFSVAASPSTFENSFQGHSASNLIDIFLFTNVASCFLVTDVVKKFGLQKAIQGAALVMTLGCWCRSGFGFLHLGEMLGPAVANAVGKGDYSYFTGLEAVPPPEDSNGLVSYALILVGTILVGAAQPFFQCTPPMLSATWFASDERATSTAVALNFNQIGIATAFLVGGGMATSTEGLVSYFGLIAVLCSLVTAGTLLQFEGDPYYPPSTSELQKRVSGKVEPPFLESVKKFFKTPGFVFPLTAFICSISTTNIVGAFIDEVMCRGGIKEQFQIDLAGAGFELAILLGGIVIGGYVDRTKEYKKVTLACIAATAALVIPLGLTEHAMGKEPLLLILALLGLGMAAGPVQPINAELAVDVTYPSDETAVESVQQIGGNLVSALLVPIAEHAANADYEMFNPPLESDIRGDVVLLTVIAAITYISFTFFDAPLRRTEADKKSNEESPQMNMDGTLMIDAEVLSKASIPTDITKLGNSIAASAITEE